MTLINSAFSSLFLSKKVVSKLCGITFLGYSAFFFNAQAEESLKNNFASKTNNHLKSFYKKKETLGIVSHKIMGSSPADGSLVKKDAVTLQKNASPYDNNLVGDALETRDKLYRKVKVKRVKHYLPEQWYTGSVYSPSPALPKAGMWAFEPYVVGTVPRGVFDTAGNYSSAPGKAGPNGFTQFTLSEYTVTNHLTLMLLPTYTYTYGNGSHHSSGLRMNDLPIEWKYRFGKNYSPSVSISFGVNAPVGKYTNLHNGQEGVGSGAWIARFGVEMQRVLPFFGHQQRFRAWAMGRQPFASTSIKNASVYNGMTTPDGKNSWDGFRGTGHYGAFGNEGFAWEGGITREWVLSFDFYHTWAQGTHYSGRFNSGKLKGTPYSGSSSGSNSFHLVGGFEYNWTSALGMVVGCDVPIYGHNTSADIQPQGAVMATF